MQTDAFVFNELGKRADGTCSQRCTSKELRSRSLPPALSFLVAGDPNDLVDVGPSQPNMLEDWEDVEKLKLLNLGEAVLAQCGLVWAGCAALYWRPPIQSGL